MEAGLCITTTVVFITQQVERHPCFQIFQVPVMLQMDMRLCMPILVEIEIPQLVNALNKNEQVMKIQ